MGYTEKLDRLLRPLGVYRLSSGAGAAELFALGKALDGAFDVSAETERECASENAEDWGLSMFESMFPLAPAYSGAEARRAAVAALLTVSDASFTLSGINAALSGCGICAAAAEAAVPQTVSVSFPGTRGVPDGINRMKAIIESIIPCHLGIDYVFAYVLWRELEALALKWRDVSEMTWTELERVE